MKLIPANKDHLMKICVREKGWADYLDNLSPEDVLRPGLSFAAEHQGRVVAAGGIMPLWHGVAEAWVIVSSDAPKFSLARMIERILPRLMRFHKLRRLQATVRDDDKTAMSFAEWLGFRAEGLMRSYGIDGSDHWRYAVHKTEGK